jgi:hypothetical protein
MLHEADLAKRWKADLRSVAPKMGSGVSNTQPPLEALSGSSAAYVMETCSCSPLMTSAISTLWHHGHAFPT